jgi:hypothetical protein
MEAAMGQNPNWRPWDFAARGQRHRIFTMTEERAISDHILDTYITRGRLFTDATFVEVAMQAFLEKYRDSDSPFQFQGSPGFISDFKRRNRFSSRRSHLKRRPTVIDDRRVHWMTTLAQLLVDVPNHERIVNVDESCWRVHPDGLGT